MSTVPATTEPDNFDSIAASTAKFAPSGPMLAYVRALCVALASHSPITNEAVCREAGISTASLWGWKRKVEGFNAWVAETVRVDAMSDVDWNLVVAAAYREAKRGSIDHARFLLELKKLELGAMRGQEAPVQIVNQGPAIVFNLPRPARDLEGREIVHDIIDMESD